ncbi:MAG: hypothetical protein ACYSWU_15045, partial [Planctomycetota bacterium]
MAKIAVNCDGAVVEPVDSSSEGCPVRTKRRVVSVSRGQCASVRWPLRWRTGEIADISACFPEDVSESGSGSESASVTTDNTIQVRFGNCDGSEVLGYVTGTVTDAEE